MSYAANNPQSQSEHPPPDKPHARLFAILARDAPKGVILRRGPRKWTELILWHTDTDIFERGQWFKGTIYGRGCDLSPDGSKFLYSCTKYHWRKVDRDRMWEWSAISKPPYYTALALWPGNEWLTSGGYFLDEHTLLWLGEYATPARGQLPEGLAIVLDQPTYENLWHKRMLLRGWHLEQELIWQYPPGVCVQAERWRKVNPRNGYSIVLKADRYYYHYCLHDDEGTNRFSSPGVTWMDWDHQGRLVYTSEGKLYASSGDMITHEVIEDFTPDEPREMIAPDWAKEW